MKYIPHVQGFKHTKFGKLDATIMNSDTAISLVAHLKDALNGTCASRREEIKKIIEYSRQCRYSNEVLRNRRSLISKQGHDMAGHYMKAKGK